VAWKAPAAVSALTLAVLNALFYLLYRARSPAVEAFRVRADRPGPWDAGAAEAAAFAGVFWRGAALAALNAALAVPLGAAGWAGVAALGYSAAAADFPSALTMAWQFAAFLAASGYAPADGHNFLRDWAGARTPPAGWEQKPVTWVDLIDARAYCAHRGMRLPHDWEWAYIASNGSAGQLFPCGDDWDAAAVPPQATGTTRPPPPDVGGYPAGDAPSGVKDLMGLVWQWTNLFRDDHTAGGLVRGGSYWGAEGSKWYFPNINGTEGPLAGSCATHNKLLLMAPAYDRHGTVGFRCVADAPGLPPPPPPPAASGCADG
jgi:hypothetical protein